MTYVDLQQPKNTGEAEWESTIEATTSEQCDTFPQMSQPLGKPEIK